MNKENEPPEDFTVTCPICHGSMTEAALRAPGGDKNVYLELHLPSHAHQKFLIRTFVCTKCGYIQLIANREQKT